MSDIAIAALLAVTVLLAATISVEIGLSVALIELFLGVVVGNAFNLDVPGWLTFVGSFAGILLTFLAGAEVDVPQLKREWRASVSIGLVSFFAPFAVVGLVAYYGLGWSRDQSEIAGLALSTTSLAVVYAVLVETGLNSELVGKRLMSATFVTDIATVTGLTVLFVKPTIWIVPFAARLGGDDLRAAEAGDGILRPVRQPRDRAGDQARLRVPVRAHVARFARALAGGAARVRARARDVDVLRLAPDRAGPDARRRVRVPDAVLLPQGRDERLGRRAVGEPRHPRDPVRRRRWGRSSPASIRSRGATRRRTRSSRRC